MQNVWSLRGFGSSVRGPRLDNVWAERIRGGAFARELVLPEPDPPPPLAVWLSSVLPVPVSESGWVKRQGRVSREEIYERDNWECFYCGDDPEWITLDHLIPQSRVTINIAGNLVTACMPCNGSKRARVWGDGELRSVFGDVEVLNAAAGIPFAATVTI